MLANHEQEYMKSRVGEDPEIGTKVQIEPRALTFDEGVSVPKTGEIIESPFDVGKYNVTVKLDNPPTYATCRVVHRIFVSEIAP